MLPSCLLILSLIRQVAPLSSGFLAGVVEGKVKQVYDALVKGEPANQVVTRQFFDDLAVPVPWTDFQESPLIHLAFGGGTEAHFKIGSMLLAGGANASSFSSTFPPAILFACGWGRKDTNEDMAATIQGLLQNEAYDGKLGLQEVETWNALMGFHHNPSVIDYFIGTKFLYGAYALVSEKSKLEQQNLLNKITHGRLAAWEGLPSMLGLFLQHGIVSDLQAKDKFGRNMLHYAVIRSHLPVLQFLLDSDEISTTAKKKLLLQRDAVGYTPLMLAQLTPSRKDLVDFLVEKHGLLRVPLELEDEEFEVDSRSGSTASSAQRNKYRATNVVHDHNDALARIEAGERFSVQLGWQVPAFPTPYDGDASEQGVLSEVDVIDAAAEGSYLESSFIRNYVWTQRPLLIRGNLSSESTLWRSLERNAFLHELGDRAYSLDDQMVPSRGRLSQWIPSLQQQKAGKGQRVELATVHELNGYLVSVPSVFQACPESESNAAHNITFNGAIEMTIGALGSGVVPHAHGNAWELLLTGRRKWILIPPGALGPRDKVWKFQSTHVLEHWKTVSDFRKKGQGITVIQLPGEILFIPSGWAHAAINMAETVTVSQEFCSVTYNNVLMEMPVDLSIELYAEV